ncbi:unnamed protein product [Orchesella dallaii]|uniref:F-box domain-containing protein n=1 Tax=Orchesella dallaii TaxID=48710 RepID=A0ABP1RS13_9HEXA
MSFISVFISVLLIIVAIIVLKPLVLKGIIKLRREYERRAEQREENGQKKVDVIDLELNGLEEEDEGEGEISSHFRKEEGTFPSLPEEIWCEILEYVKEPQDILSCINASSVWSRILEDQKTKVMLPSVLSQLVGYLDEADLLRCRLVSSHWKSVVDDLLENYQTSSYRPSYRTTKMDLMISKNNMTGIVEMRNFVVEMDSLVNPFPSRSLSICVSPLDFTPNAETIIEYCSAVSELVINYGHHLHRFQYTMKVFEYPGLFRLLLAFFPNLQHLELEVPFLSVEGYTDLVRNEFEPPLPRMTSLKSVSVLPTSGQLSPVILSALLRDYGNQLEVLQCYGVAFVSIAQQNQDNPRNEPWLPALRELTLDYVKGDAIRVLQSNSWSLDKLYLVFSRKVEDEEKVKLETLLQMIDNMAETLSELHLCLDWTLDDFSHIFLNERKELHMKMLRNMSKFPKLKTLVISRDFMEVPIVYHLAKENFVVLERLSIDLGMFQGNEYSRGLRMSDDSQSLLWRLRPTLKVIEREGRLLTWISCTVGLPTVVTRKCFRELKVDEKLNCKEQRSTKGRGLNLTSVTKTATKAAHVVVNIF